VARILYRISGTAVLLFDRFSLSTFILFYGRAERGASHLIYCLIHDDERRLVTFTNLLMTQSLEYHDWEND
jgi:hypothetical protein